MAVLFVLLRKEDETSWPLAVYSDLAEAGAAAARLERQYEETHPAFNAWCHQRWEIVERWRASGRIKNGPLSLPDDAGEREIREMIGPCPPLEGHERCSVVEAENRLQ